MDKHAPHPGGSEHPDHGIERPSLADRPEVEFDAGAGESHPPGMFVDLDMRHPRPLAGRGQHRSVGSPALTTEKAPGPDEAAGGRVKRSPGLFMETQRLTQQCHDIPGDRLPALRRGGVETD